MAALLALPACTSEQAEGKRCDLRNGNLDCEAPLLCRSATELSLTDKSEGVALCCPAPGQSVTVNACRSSNAILPPDPLDDAGTSSTPSNSADASTSDAGTGNSVPPDASTGSGSTASVDAGPVDAGSAAVDAAAAAASDASATSTVDSGA